MVKLRELHDALQNWTDGHPVTQHHWEAGHMFMKYLGIRSWRDLNTHIEMPEEAARRLRLLLGPYANTVIKAWYAKHY